MKNIVEQGEGEINAYSEGVGSGSSFCFSLKLKREADNITNENQLRIVLREIEKAPSLRSRKSDFPSQGGMFSELVPVEEYEVDEMIVSRRPHAIYNINELLSGEIIVEEEESKRAQTHHDEINESMQIMLSKFPVSDNSITTTDSSISGPESEGFPF